MPRVSRISEKRRALLPVLARAFADLGYRKATTASLAKRCGIQENVLYRLWPDKKAMFLAAIEFTFEFSEQAWLRLLQEVGGEGSTAQRLLSFEARHHGEFRHYRIAFIALAESDDSDIHDALRRMYARFHRFLVGQLLAHREVAGPAQPTAAQPAAALQPETAAWAAMGLGTIVSIGRELGMLMDADRERIISDVGRVLLGEVQ